MIICVVSFRPETGSQRPGRHLKIIMEAVGFKVTDYGPVGSHRDPICGRKYDFRTQDLCFVKTEDTCCVETEDMCCVENPDMCCVEILKILKIGIWKQKIGPFQIYRAIQETEERALPESRDPLLRDA